MTPTAADLMALERRWLGTRRPGAYEAEIRAQWDMSAIRWAQLVVASLHDGSAWEADPITARMLRDRAASRSPNGRRRGPDLVP